MPELRELGCLDLYTLITLIKMHASFNGNWKREWETAVWLSVYATLHIPLWWFCSGRNPFVRCHFAKSAQTFIAYITIWTKVWLTFSRQTVSTYVGNNVCACLCVCVYEFVFVAPCCRNPSNERYTFYWITCRTWCIPMHCYIMVTRSLAELIICAR